MPSTPLPLPLSSMLRVPRQQRSTETVHAILDTAWQITVDAGVGSLTTARIAERSGINVASLYQYFANREMIVSAIIERHLLAQQSLFRHLIATAPREDFETLLRRGLEATLAAIRPTLPAVRDLVADIPALSETSIGAYIAKMLAELLRDFLIARGDEYRLEGGHAKVFVLANSLTFATLRWIVEQPTLVDEQSLIDSVVDVAGKFLVRR